MSNATTYEGATCPRCGSSSVAKYLWGMPCFNERLQRDLDASLVALGGCCITDDDPEWHCNACGCDFGHSPIAQEMCKVLRGADACKSIIYGAAVGDALGVPYEFMERGSFKCVGMANGGVHDMPRGTFSDDTSLLLATQDSIRMYGGVNIDDMRIRFRAWLNEGRYMPDGFVFDVGNTTAAALRRGYGCDGERDNGNGSLMRIAPLACTDATDDEIREVSAITHAHAISKEACVVFVHILRDVLRNGSPSLEVAVKNCASGNERFAFLLDIASWPREKIKSGGYVLDTLGAALWCAMHTENYRECVLKAVNLGGDTDTTACVAGALAGALYGFKGIPDDWVRKLRGKNIIDACLGGNG